MCVYIAKSYSHFFSKKINVYAIFNEQSFNDMLSNDIVSFEQLGPDISAVLSFVCMSVPLKGHSF